MTMKRKKDIFELSDAAGESDLNNAPDSEPAPVLEEVETAVSDPKSALAYFFKDARRISYLRSDETIEKIRRMRSLERKKSAKAQKQIAALRDEIVEGNIRLVVKFAGLYEARSGSLEMNDLIQEGVFGLYHCIEKFDIDVDFRFSTYAVVWIRQAIGRAIIEKGRPIRVPVHAVEMLRKIDKKRMSIEEAAQYFNTSEKYISRLLNASFNPISLELPVGDGDNDDSLKDFLADGSALSESSIIESMDQAKLAKKISSLLKRLDPKWEFVIRKRFGIGCKPLTLQAIGDIMGVTRERVRQMQVKALTKLKALIRIYCNEYRIEFKKEGK